MGETTQHERKAREVVLVTGGAGYIGSHTAVELLQQGYFVVIVDNLYNSAEECVNRIRELVGDHSQFLAFHKVDLCDRVELDAVFRKYKMDAVVHFAGLKAVGESVAEPLKYYTNNVTGTLNLLECMKEYNCKKLVFSSSATVYGQPKSVPCMEDFPLQATNPYGRTKLFIEEILNDLYESDKSWRIIMLRYFNPVGAHPSGRIGEDPVGIPNNLMPFVEQVAVGRRKELTVFGKDYPTRDGTGIRDYIHVLDLAAGHVAALRKLAVTTGIGCEPYNLGTGRGTSVLEMVAAFEKASGKKIPLRISDRRPGDCAEVFASTKKAEAELGWKAKFGIEEMCRDQWRWACRNPWGYRHNAAAELHQSAPSAGQPAADSAKQGGETGRSTREEDIQAPGVAKSAMQGGQEVHSCSAEEQKDDNSDSLNPEMQNSHRRRPVPKLVKSASATTHRRASGQDSASRLLGKPEKGYGVREGVEENIQSHGKKRGDGASSMGRATKGMMADFPSHEQQRKGGSTTAGPNVGNVTSALGRSTSIGPGTGARRGSKSSSRSPPMRSCEGSGESRSKVPSGGFAMREFAHEVTNDILFRMTSSQNSMSIPALIYHSVMSSTDACNTGWMEAVVGPSRGVLKEPSKRTILGSTDLTLGVKNGTSLSASRITLTNRGSSGVPNALKGLHHTFPLAKSKSSERCASVRHSAPLFCETMHVRSHMVGIFQKPLDKSTGTAAHLSTKVKVCT